MTYSLENSNIAAYRDDKLTFIQLSLLYWYSGLDTQNFSGKFDTVQVSDSTKADLWCAL